MSKQQIARVGDLAEGTTIKFQFARQDKVLDGFVARFRGQLVAYENLCRHLPLTLDYDDNRFFTRDGRFLACQTHGAVYEPLTGLCVRGPCEGARLKPLNIEVKDGVVWLLI